MPTGAIYKSTEVAVFHNNLTRWKSIEKLNNVYIQCFNVTHTVVSCVSNDDSFATEVYEYLFSRLEKQKQFEDGKNLQITKELIRFVDVDKAIHIDNDTLVPMGMIKWVLDSFLKSDTVRFKDHDVIEFGDTFTIGKILDPSKKEFLSCEICGFFTPYTEELHTYRMTHYGLG